MKTPILAHSVIGPSLFGVGGDRSGGDGSQVEFAAGQVDHRGEVLQVAGAPGPGLDVLDDAVEAFGDRVGVPVVEVGENVVPVAVELAGEGFHGFQA